MAKKKKKARKRRKRPSKAKPENLKNRRGMNPKQNRFCEEYVIDLHPAKAYVRAGYSERGAEQSAHKLLGKTEVLTRIIQLMDKRAERTGVTAERVVAELALLGFSDIGDYEAGADGKLAMAGGAEEKKRRAVSSLKTTRRVGGDGAEVTTELKLWSKPEALKLLAMNLGMLIDRKHHTGDGTATAQVVIFPSNGREVGDNDDNTGEA